MSPAGTLLNGRYRLLEPLASGGMGTVWRGQDELLGRPVAVKEVLLPPDLDAAGQDVLRRRTMREARAAARLRHPGVVTVYDVVEQAGRPWIVMELVRSRSLDGVLRERGPMSPAGAAHIGRLVLAALVAAHSAGVLHRDVKPGNVLLADDGRVVLTDFGIARLSGDATVTTTGSLVGSPSYISPERARGEQPGPESDLWSLGALLYTAVEGVPPFQREGSLATLSAVLTEDVPVARRAGALWPVIHALLIKDPARRLTAAPARIMLDRAAAAANQATPMATPPLGGHKPGGQQPLGDRPTLPAPAEPTAPTAADPVVPVGPSPTTTPLPPTYSRLRRADEPASTGPPATPPPAAKQPAPAPQPATGRAPAGPAAPTADIGPPRQPRSQRGWWLAAAVAVAGGVAAILALTTVRSDGGAGGQAAPSTRTTRSTAPSGQTQPPARSTTPTGRATAPAPTRSAPSARPATPSVPAGFVRYRDSTGFALAIPAGWQPVRKSQRVDFQEPSGGRFLRIDQTDSPKGDPVADWQGQEAVVSQRLPGYRLLRPIVRVDYRGWQAADWEFTWVSGGITIHVLNRNVVTSPTKAYALYWSVPQSQWDSSRQIFDVAATTFQPAG